MDSNADSSANNSAAAVSVQVCIALPARQILVDLQLSPQTTLLDAIHLSRIMEQAPEVTLESCRIGIYGKIKAPDTLVKEGDRIEVYRPLTADPKESRRRRVDSKLKKKAGAS